MSKQKNILYICGTINQTSQMHEISKELPGFRHHFTPYYADGYLEWARRNNMLEFSILGNKLGKRATNYLKEHRLTIDYRGGNHAYDLVLTCSDLVIPYNVRGKRTILVQEGMTDPEGLAYYLVKYLKLPRYMASTSATVLSMQYDYFCVASEGYKKHFIRKGVEPERLIVTGIPNFDNCAEYNRNNFPYRHYVLVATSDMRETFRYENRRRFIRNCVELAKGRQLIFKLHPNENAERAAAEIMEYAPGSLVFSGGNINHMIANCDTLITRFSSVVYIGLAMGKEVYSDFELDELREMVPWQNGRTSARNIADVCRRLLGGELPPNERKYIPGRTFASLRRNGANAFHAGRNRSASVHSAAGSFKHLLRKSC